MLLQITLEQIGKQQSIHFIKYTHKQHTANKDLKPSQQNVDMPNNNKFNYNSLHLDSERTDH